MRTVAGGVVGLAICALAFITWAALLPGQSCGFVEGPCEVTHGTYSVRVPPKGPAGTPAVLYLHGSRGGGEDIVRSEAVVKAVLERGWTLLAPTGLTMTYETGPGTGWNLRNFPGPERDEAAFLSSVITDAVARFGIDRDRVWIVGDSNGAFLAWELACLTPGTASAYAAVNGTFMNPAPDSCDAAVPMLHVHGLQDEVVPMAGTDRYASVDVGFGLFRAPNGCEGTPARLIILPGGGSRTDWPGCNPSSPMSRILLPEGHQMTPEMFETTLDWLSENAAAEQ